MKAEQEIEHKGWHSRGYLPHFDSPATIQSLTFRLVDSLPKSKQYLLEEDDYLEQFKAVESCMDTGYGECLLKNRVYAELVQNALLHFDRERYRLLAWAIMPNHVHCVIDLLEGWTLGGIVASWKGFTSKTANRRFKTNGNLWARDYYDRYIRNEKHLRDVIEYIHQNPVKAGLVIEADAWEWSSAGPRASPLASSTSA